MATHEQKVIAASSHTVRDEKRVHETSSSVDGGDFFYELATSGLSAILKILRILLILSLVVLIFVIASVTNGDLFLVVYGFLPTILTVIVFMAFQGRVPSKAVWLLPPILCFVFYFLSMSFPFASTLDIPQLTAANLILSIIYLAFLTLLQTSDSPRSRERPVKRKEQVTTVVKTETKVQEAKKEVVQKTEKEQIRYFARTIEDKCKAINFVIGRVYTRRNGASEKLRDMIKIDSQLYNSFSQLNDAAGFTSETEEILKKIMEMLNRLYSKESEIFGPACKGFTNIKHESDGTDKIIDVLIKNDSDPVKDYFVGALESCDNLLKQVQKRKKDMPRIEQTKKYPPEDNHPAHRPEPGVKYKDGQFDVPSI